MDKEKLQEEIGRIRQLPPEQFAEMFDDAGVKSFLSTGDNRALKRATDKLDLLAVAATDLQLVAAVRKYFQEQVVVPDVDLAAGHVGYLWHQRAELIKKFGLDFNTDELSPEALMEIAKNVQESCKTHLELRDHPENLRDSSEIGNAYRA